MSRGNIFLALFVLLLLVSGIFLFQSVKEDIVLPYLPDSDIFGDSDTVDTSDSDTSGSDTSGSDTSGVGGNVSGGQVHDDFYVDERNGVGYAKNGNSVYFFKVFQPSEGKRYVNAFAKTQGPFEYDFRWSDDGTNWESLYVTDHMGYLEAYSWVDVRIGSSGKVYLSVKTIENCSDPVYELEVLKQTFFFDGSLFYYSYASAAGDVVGGVAD